MKLILTFSFLIYFTISFSQENKINEKKFKTEEEPAWYLDSIFVSPNTIKYIPTEDIKNTNVVKKNTTINGIIYTGQIYLTTKDPKKYNFISLEQIKSEYTESRNNNVIYMINDEFIKDNIETYKIDKNYIFKVELSNSKSFDNLKKVYIDLDIINILGKTKQNTENKNDIKLRGYQAIGIK